MGLPLTGTLGKNPFKFKGTHTKEPVNKEQVKGLGLGFFEIMRLFL